MQTDQAGIDINKSLTHYRITNKIAKMHGKSHKQEARKFDRISWNSNRQSPCEINCDLIIKDGFYFHFQKWEPGGSVVRDAFFFCHRVS